MGGVATPAGPGVAPLPAGPPPQLVPGGRRPAFPVPPHKENAAEPGLDHRLVGLGLVAADRPPPLQLADPLEDGGRREPEPPRDLDVGRPGVFLEHPENFPVHRVDGFHGPRVLNNIHVIK